MLLSSRPHSTNSFCSGKYVFFNWKKGGLVFFSQSRGGSDLDIIFFFFLTSVVLLGEKNKNKYTKKPKKAEHVKCVLFLRFMTSSSSFSDDNRQDSKWSESIRFSGNLFFSHCGGGTGAEGWSVSPGRGAVGSVKQGEKNVKNLN